MDIFTEVIDRFSRLPYVGAWQEARAMFEHAAALKPNHWLIPVRACQAVGGSVEQAVPAILAIGCAHVGIVLIDDMLDDDPRGDYHRIGMPVVSNLACFFQAAALRAASQCTTDHICRLAALEGFNEMFLTTSFGQFLDVQAPASESGYWQVAKTKSSPFFRAALQLGVLAGGGSLEAAEKLEVLGDLYGEMIQIHDDMHDSMETPANPDWLQGRSPLPILFASLVRHPQQAQFLELREYVDQPDALREAQEILIRCGAISYCADQLIKKYEEVQEIMKSICLMHNEPIVSLFEEVIAPVDSLLQAADN